MDHRAVAGSLVLMVPMMVGCAETVTVAGNAAAMVVASVMLWSTVNLGVSKRTKEG